MCATRRRRTLHVEMSRPMAAAQVAYRAGLAESAVGRNSHPGAHQEAHMDDAKAQQAALARLRSAIERAAGDLSIEEEPARFVAALDDGAPEEVA